jgi:hypothetical protein
MTEERDSKGRFIKGHSLGHRFVKGQTSPNKGRHYKCCQYNLTASGKEQKIRNLGEYVDKSGLGTITPDGYKLVWTGTRQMFEQQFVWSKYNLMPVPKGCVIHHTDMNKLNNKIENLMLLPRDVHTSVHRQHTLGRL